MKKIKVGLIGCGNISSVYFKNCLEFEHFELVACADLDLERTRAQAARYGVNAYTIQELLNDEDIELVINLTTPKAHAAVCIQALEAGKHVYTEKPLAVTREEGRQILDVAKQKGLRIGSAPDTFLGGGIQTAIHLIEKGEIGTPIGATAFMMSRGHEHWHPDPSFYYDVGGGPMFDMGPYYLTALIAMLGPIKRISGSARISYPERTITSEPKAGTKIQVQTPTHISGVLDFSSGAIGTLITSFDVFGGSTLPRMEVYGSEGTLLVPDPNTFGGPVLIRKRDEHEFVEVPLTHYYDQNSRGIGVADMAESIQRQRAHRANGELAFHVLEAMHGFHDASNNGTFYHMESTCLKPAPLPLNYHFSPRTNTTK
ncbi:oxidoreductase [Alkalihalobacillus alcalophilus ATCC 27647 = CGMCC 1.3604]|uniref:Oxidoreductase n=1 Tax=Alkalihalobacillus alcalophilus ATCC 27647 = CGMCC 1.3604 TaxID=1218173 RepID=A0A4S4K387_ALKAL|nr:Gfo/Idh/MocA family oxidoreductase [Alkalihalobacillus alcalophilus]MED1564335.1 Gfo/Idh/MocA family oxidoreductase [Alkalihalobacillus alcalophilus]THG91720.1 oxidoreductase [Alkalihalobacillus alcalophilus ATCC 27647 = CGMCC 1.3604]